MYHSTSSSQRTCAAVVVGGGPAGITVLGNLLEHKDKLPAQRLLWVDPHFRAGRVNARYREVPSNTAVKLFIQWAEAVAPLRSIVEKTPQPNAVTALRELPQDKGCELSKAADLCLMLTDGLAKENDVQQHMGKVTQATFDKTTKHWTVSLDDGAPVTTPTVVLCTGSSPISQPLPIVEQLTDLRLRSLHLDTALTPSILAKTFDPEEPVTVAVVGASHSAILVLMNLSTLAASSHPNLRVKWFTRNKLRYAEYMDGWILRDNTGLKGQAAQWARENLEDEVFAQSPVSKCIKKVWMQREAEEAAYKRELPGCTHVVQAVGYKRDALPKLAITEGEGAPAEPLDVIYDHLTGRFFVPGLFGAGIAFPERVTDPYGNVEYAVGFFKFMKFAKRVVPEWVSKR
ncbi:pyridine nucleotide-disulfide oxidoreductase-domain-containing protein [Macrophomina phaseolina]|uniref:Pyridine nucleotide-disulfide oxidoreductase-domain-containing protein n=1 Tax=Macrophomina phaseolina TaxID=35725 RepID=A0ABQ8FV94_9PEZI|nr:pyridine nucleotide-disulfide oxidoreductase-domain-containing protein [Macrophomina phaseolina]